jgi:hypothetical protein
MHHPQSENLPPAQENAGSIKTGHLKANIMRGAHNIRIGINLGEDHIMVDTINIGLKHSKQWKVSSLLRASIVGGCLVIAAPVFAKIIDAPVFAKPEFAKPESAKTDAEKMKDMEDKLEAIQNQLSQMTSGMASRSSSDNGLPMHGFMDVGFASNSQGNAAVNPNLANPKGFYEGRLSFYLSPHFGDNVKVLAEPNIEVSQKEGTVNLDVERLQIGYTFSDAATAWIGRFHSPYGYWNTAFHHGAQLQTAVLRPRFLDFEDSGGVLPAHMLGVWSTGKVKAGGGRFTYDVYAGNGPKIVDANPSVPAVIVNPLTDYQGGGLDPNISGDDNHSAMIGLNLGYEFSDSLDGLRLSVHGLQGDVNAYGTSSPTPTTQNTTSLNTTNLSFVGSSVVYLSNDWEIMGEYYHFNDKDMSGTTGTHKSWADYLQVGKSFNDLTPYVRFERTKFNQRDNYFSMQASGQSYARQALGLRYNLNQKAALKFELLNSSFKAEPGRTALGYRSFLFQYAIGF